jgi:hypothetical protein
MGGMANVKKIATAVAPGLDVERSQIVPLSHSAFNSEF